MATLIKEYVYGYPDKGYNDDEIIIIIIIIFPKRRQRNLT
jgi:hypothetical protein